MVTFGKANEVPTENVSWQARNQKAMSNGADPAKAFNDIPGEVARFDLEHNTSGTPNSTSLAPHDPGTSDNEGSPIPKIDHLQMEDKLGSNFTARARTEKEAQGTSQSTEVQPDDALDEDAVARDVAVAATKKKSKKRKPKSQRGGKAATGFEEYYVDAPLTPQQHEEEKGLYDASRTFAERIETAIQRYVSKRNLDPDRKNLFDKYLTFGGVEGGPKMFSGGLDHDTLANSNAAGIAALTATHSVPFDRDDERHHVYTVDFEGCLRGFLSSRLPAVFELNSEEDVKKYVGIIKNFLNYLLHHDVCPEHKQDIEASRKLCDQAQIELWNIAEAQPLLPGSFNMACSEMFGGTYKGLHDPAGSEWMKERDKEFGPIGMSPEQARKVLKFGLAAYATHEQITLYKAESKRQTYEVVETTDIDLEITDIILGSPVPDVAALYRSEADLDILGKLRAKTWRNPGALGEDLNPEEEQKLIQNPQPVREYEFWVDDKLLSKLHVGLKIEATVKKLSFGIAYFDAVQVLRPSFYTLLPNELMLGWRKIEDQWLPPRQKNEDGEQSNNELRDDDEQKQSKDAGKDLGLENAVLKDEGETEG